MSLLYSWAHLNSPILSVLEQLYLFIKQKCESRRSHLFSALHCLQCLWHPMHKDRYAYKSRDNMERITEELAKLFDFCMYRHMTGHDFRTMNLFPKILCTILTRNSNKALPLLSNRTGIGIFRFNTSKFSSGKQSIKQSWSAIFQNRKTGLLRDRRQIIMCLVSANLASWELQKPSAEEDMQGLI